MDRSDELKLITITRTQDANGVWQASETSRTIFVQVGSVTRSEFFEGGRNGLNPAYVFRCFFADYNDETICEYAGKRYAIYRTYLARNDVLELYAERKGGTNGSHTGPSNNDS